MKKLSKNKKILIVLLLSVLVIGGAVVYPLFRPYTPPSQSNQTDNQSPEEAETSETPDTTKPEQPETPVKEYELITENEKYKIRREPDSNKYTITLYAIINRPEQHDQYHEQLREYKQEALQYLQDSGVDSGKLDITYDPVEAKDL